MFAHVSTASVPLDVRLEVGLAALICVGRSDALRAMATVVEQASVQRHSSAGAQMDIRIGTISVSDFELVNADASVLGMCV